MDSLIAAASRALAGGDMLAALQHVALRDDPPALALRGIAMAQLGEHARARALLRRAARGFGTHEALAQARCVVADAEVALAMRELGGSPRSLSAASALLAARGELANALQARLVALRRLLLLGRLGEAANALGQLDVCAAPPAHRAVAALAAAELALRSLRIEEARAALDEAQAQAAIADVPALQAEVAEARAALERPAARLAGAGGGRALRLAEVASLLDSGDLVVDACRRGLRRGMAWQSLARRPILFALLHALAMAWPHDADRADLIARAFRTHRPDDSHRARLRVEVGRLRVVAGTFARIEATARGFALKPRDDGKVVVLEPPIEGSQASLLALLADGEGWSTSALALALGASQRSVQRALAGLEAERRVRCVGHARAQRWLAPPLAGFTTILLLPAALPPG